MKITPLDIQQQQFRVKFRGFDMVEVDNFLDVVANEYEELLREINQLKDESRQKSEKIQQLEGEEKELRNVLISAQQICEEIKSNARKEGELIIEEAKGNARKIMDTAHARAMEVEAGIAQLKRQRAEFDASLKAIIDTHLRMLEASRENRPGEDAEKIE
jgi:cell division initiation protein